jgi:hypothetical protein
LRFGLLAGFGLLFGLPGGGRRFGLLFAVFGYALTAFCAFDLPNFIVPSVTHRKTPLKEPPCRIRIVVFSCYAVRFAMAISVVTAAHRGR